MRRWEFKEEQTWPQFLSLQSSQSSWGWGEGVREPAGIFRGCRERLPWWWWFILFGEIAFSHFGRLASEDGLE